jgi:hypothetical protein
VNHSAPCNQRARAEHKITAAIRSGQLGGIALDACPVRHV